MCLTIAEAMEVRIALYCARPATLDIEDSNTHLSSRITSIWISARHKRYEHRSTWDFLLTILWHGRVFRRIGERCC